MKKLIAVLTLVLTLFTLLVSCDPQPTSDDPSVHVCSYDKTTHVCSVCHSVSPDVVAYLGQSFDSASAYFITLQEAITYVKNELALTALDVSNTIRLSKDTSCSDLVIEDVEVAIDFGSHKLTFEEDSVITIKNSSFELKSSYTDAKIEGQNITIKAEESTVKTQVSFKAGLELKGSSNIEISKGSVEIASLDVQGDGIIEINTEEEVVVPDKETMQKLLDVIDEEKTNSSLQIAGHTHSFTDYYFDEQSHWQECLDCDYKTNFGSHIWDSGLVLTTPTCLEDGTALYTCTVCGTTKTDVVSALGHNLVHHDKADSSCTVAGHNAYYTCTRCTFTDYVEIPIVEHKYIEVAEEAYLKSPATCTSKAVYYKSCTYCKITSTDTFEYGTELSHNYVTMTDSSEHWCECSICGGSTEHEYHNWNISAILTSPTCLENGTALYTCTVCGTTKTDIVSALGHDLVHHEKANSTCTTAGHNAYDTCSRCTFTDYVEIPATGHEYAEVAEEAYLKSPATCTSKAVYYKSCTYCKTTSTDTFEYGTELSHNYVTMTDLTSHWQQCTKCSDIKNYEEHNWNISLVLTSPTCLENGTALYTCTVCGTTKTDVVSAFGHNLVHHDNANATCQVAGHNAYDTCTRCTFTDYVEIPIVDHMYIEVAEEAYLKTAATCTSKAVYYKSCTYCKITSTDTFEYGSELPHSYITMTDSSEHWFECANCGSSTEHEDHNWSISAILTSPTCLEDGTGIYTCTVCGTTKTDVVSALGHDLVHHDKANATCQVVGHNAYDTCTRCTFTDYVEIPIVDHMYIEVAEEAYLKTAATCTSKAVYYKSCTYCKTTITDTFEYGSEPSHNYVTKTDSSEHWCECSICGSSTEHEDHNWNSGVVVSSATCTKGSVVLYTCTVCGLTRTDVGEPLGHDIVHHDKADATCKVAGHTAYDTCSRCSYTSGYETIPKIDHVWDDGTVTSSATCQKTGKKTYTCTLCGLKKTETIPITDHDLNSEHTCTMCGQKFWYYMEGTTIYAFSDLCFEMEGEVVIPDGVTKIGDRAFYNFIGITAINIPDSVTEIGENAFWDCIALESINQETKYWIFKTDNNIPSNVTKIGRGAFHGCSALTSLSIEGDITVVEPFTFYGCTSLNGLTFSKKLTSIGDHAFYACAISSIDLSNVTYLGKYAFGESSTLTHVTYPKLLSAIPEGCFFGTGISSLSLPNNITSIGKGAFSECLYLTTLTLGSSLTYVGPGAFGSCKALKTVNFKANLTSIEPKVFANCTSLTTITLPNTVQTIGYHAFSDCEALTSINRPTSLVTVDPKAFDGAGCSL